VTSGNGNVTQSGALVVTGTSSFNAGTGVVTLIHASNNLTGSVTAVASAADITSGNVSVLNANNLSQPIANGPAIPSDADTRRTAEDAGARIAGSIPVVPIPSLTANPSNPPPLEVGSSSNSVTAASSMSNSVRGTTAVSASTSITSAGSASGSKSSAGTGAATGNSNSAGVTIDLQETTTAANAMAMAAVSLPKGTSTTGIGFNFELPETVRSMAQEPSSTQAQLPNGAPLPTWLKFDNQSLRFEAKAIPDGAFPLQVALNIGGQRVLVVISERTE
jgi:hypothetical protein